MFWARKKREDDLERELRSHLELEAEEQGDRYAAKRALGNLTLVQEATREAWGFTWLPEFVHDLRYGCRALKQSPGFAAVAVLTAALGIGANTSIFTVVHAVLMHPLPYRDAGRLVAPIKIGKDTMISMGVGDFEYAAWRDQDGIWDGIAAYAGRRFTLTGRGDAEELRGEAVTPGFLHTLGVAPLIGRDFTSADAEPRGGHVALVSYGLWKGRLGGDAAIVGQTITLDGKSYNIAGVLPRDFEFPENVGVHVLVAMSEPGGPAPNGAVYFYSVVARLRPGVPTERAHAALDAVERRIEPSIPLYLRKLTNAEIRVLTLHDKLVGDVRPALLVLSGAVAMVLLIVCVNISNLLLARAVARQKEMAVRIALGAARSRILRQLLTEGLLLAALGGVAGLALAFGGVAVLRAIAPEGVPHIDHAGINAAVLAFNLAIALLSGILFGLAPLRGISGADPETALRQTSRSASGSRTHRRLENLLVVAEVAFALILLAGAGLLVRTFAGLTAISPGFQPDHVLTAEISLPYWKYRTPESRLTFLNLLLERVRTGPGVTAAGAVACLPYGGPMMTNALQVEGQPDPPKDGTAEQVAMNVASSDYFRALRIPILEGRAIDSSDRAGHPNVAVINQTLARRYFPGSSPIGIRIRMGGSREWLQIVGVFADLKQGGGLAGEVRPELFQPAAQSDNGGAARMLALRSTADPRALIPWLRRQIAEIDKDVPPPDMETMRERMASLVATQRFVMRLLGIFAGLAIVLAAIGIYSVLVYAVERRTHEIGIRLALGARRSQIVGLVVSRGLRLSISGSLLGTLGGLLLTRYLKSLLYGVTPHDPLTLSAGCAVVIVVAAIAAYLPARRATNHDPISTLRAD